MTTQRLNLPQQQELVGLPAGRLSYRVWEVARYLAHSTDQVNELIELGKFGPCINCGQAGRKSYAIPHAGLIKFLRENSH